MQSRRRIPSRRPAPQRGVVALMFGLSLLVLIGFAGLALDGARLYVNKAELQNAADACALATAQELNPGAAGPVAADFTRARAAGVLVARRNTIDFQSQALLDADVTVEFAAAATGAAWTQAGTTNDFVARCKVVPAALSLWLMPALGISSATVSATAAATRNLAGLNCAPRPDVGPGQCAARASLLQ